MSERSVEDLEKLVKDLDTHLGRVVLNRLRSFGDGLNQVEISSDATETHSSVRLRSIRAAQELRARGIGVGDLIIVCANTHNDVSIPILASLYLGSSLFPFSMTMTKTEIKNLLVLGKPSIIFCDPGISQKFVEALSDLNYENVQIVVFDKNVTNREFLSFDVFTNPTGTEEDFKCNEFDPSKTISFISCSSGTTGLPKGVCHTHRSTALGFYFITVSSATKLTEKSIYLSFSTVYWISGLYNVLMSAVGGLTRISCAVPYSTKLLHKALDKYKPNGIMLSPVGICDLVKDPLFLEIDLSSVKAFYVGGSTISPDVVAQIQKRLTGGLVMNAYGMTEIGGVSVNAKHMLNMPTSSGTIHPWIHWKVVDPDTGAELGPNKIGELKLKTSCLFESYYKNPTATANAYDSEGWYKTGDLTYYNEDKLIFIVDRIKEVMKYKNYQITPAELEFEILKVPNVVQVAVVAKIHSEDGDHPLAFVQKVPGSDVTAQQIKDAIKNTLSEIKQLRGGVVFLENLPETPSGKVDRKLLKELALSV